MFPIAKSRNLTNLTCGDVDDFEGDGDGAALSRRLVQVAGDVVQVLGAEGAAEADETQGEEQIGVAGDKISTWGRKVE